MLKYSRPLIATILMTGGLFQLVAPVLADGTKAGTSISNTATASYDDPNQPGTPINATSNEVKVTVALVAGITVTGGGVTGGAITPGNNLYYNYTLTNVGNDPTKFHIPSVVTISGPGTINTGLTANPTGVEYSTDGGVTWLPVTAGGLDTPGNVAVGGAVLVRVAVTVNAGAGTSLDVRLGNTPNDQQNQLLSTSGAFDDVYTVGGAPANGQREASATVKGAIGSIAKNIALATVLTTRTGTNDNNTPSDVTDDVISYKLDLRVEGTDITNTGITPAPLAGTDIKVGGTTSKRILVSNAVPAGTTLATAVVAPTGWTTVYTTDSTDTANAGYKVANDAAWSTTFTAAATRIGFVSNTGTVIAPNATIPSFTFSVKTTGKTGLTYTVDSIAQAFGTTSGGDLAIVVYDESGDQNPNNFDGSTPANATATALSPTVSALTAAATSGSASGVALPLIYGVDIGNNNTGLGLAGEVNEYTYIYIAPVPLSLLNGPVGAPQADGPDAGGVINNNYDYTNKSSAVPAGSKPNDVAGIDPDKVSFSNTIKNTGTTTTNISLLPEFLSATNKLAPGTTVRIYTSNGQSVTYIVTITGFKFDTTATNNAGSSNGALISALNSVITIDNVAPNATVDYQVEVNLPAGTLLSTDIAKGFPVVINAFVGGTITGVIAGTELSVIGTTASNKTIDRIYTGFISLVKETRILPGSGPAVAPSDVNFSNTLKTPASGNIIEYRITYKNISESQVGNNNSILNAEKLTITEDGTTTNNTWGQDKDLNGVIDTSNIVTSAVDTAGTISLFKGTDGLTAAIDQTGTTAATDVTKYIDKVTTVIAPGISGSFSFKRTVN
jgi:hypothetical protein